MAHEINNPLAGILIYAELLQRAGGTYASPRENIEEIIGQTMRCQKIVSRLLDFSRQSLGDRNLVDVNDVIRHGVDLILHQSLFHNIEVLQELYPVLPHWSVTRANCSRSLQSPHQRRGRHGRAGEDHHRHPGHGPGRTG